MRDGIGRDGSKAMANGDVGDGWHRVDTLLNEQLQADGDGNNENNIVVWGADLRTGPNTVGETRASINLTGTTGTWNEMGYDTENIVDRVFLGRFNSGGYIWHNPGRSEVNGIGGWIHAQAHFNLDTGNVWYAWEDEVGGIHGGPVTSWADNYDTTLPDDHDGGAVPAVPPMFDIISPGLIGPNDDITAIDNAYVFLVGPVVPDTTFTWNANDLGSWTKSWTWLPPGQPNNPNHTVVFADMATITGPTTVGTNTAVTVNRIEFTNTTHSFSVSGHGSVNLAATTDPNSPVNPFVSVAGNHLFQTKVNLMNNATVNIDSDSTLVFDGALNLTGFTLSKTGDGTMFVRNDLVESGGLIDIQQGTVAGNGTIGGDVSNGGTIAPGNSPGILTIDGNLNNGASGTIVVEIEGTSGAGDSAGHDQIQVTGSSTLAGTLSIVSGANYADPTERAARDNFTLLASAGGSTGTFGTVNYNDAGLSADFTGANGSTRSHQGNGLFRNINYDGNNVSLTNLFALEGDADGDIDIDITDFNILASNFDDAGANAETNSWTTADFDADGDIDITDFNFLAANFSDTGYGENTTGQVPEPTTWLLTLIGLAGLATYVSGSSRRKRF